MVAQSNQSDRISFDKLKKLSIPSLSLVIFGFTATSTLANTFSTDTYGDRECVQLSRQYDDTVQLQRMYEAMTQTTHIGNDPLFSRTDTIEIRNSQQHLASDINRLRDKLITDCPDYATGL